MNTLSLKADTSAIAITYAESVNEKFQTEQDIIVDLKERWNESFIKKDPSLTEFLPQMLQEFRDRFPQYTMFEDMYADMVQMSENSKERRSAHYVYTTLCSIVCFWTILGGSNGIRNPNCCLS